MPTLLFKYIIIGDTAVGKSSILSMFSERIFRDTHDTTIGVEFGARDIELGGSKVKLEIWDTVYDVTQRATFEHLGRWLAEARQNADNPHLVVMCIANKGDLDHARQVSAEEGRAFAEENGLQFAEVSAKNSTQVEEVFVRTAERIFEELETNPRPKHKGGIKMKPPDSRKQKSECCDF